MVIAFLLTKLGNFFVTCNILRKKNMKEARFCKLMATFAAKFHDL